MNHDRYSAYHPGGRRQLLRARAAGFVVAAVLFGAILPAAAIIIEGYTTTLKMKAVAISDDGKLKVDIGDGAVPVLSTPYNFNCIQIPSTGSVQGLPAHAGRLASHYGNAGTQTLYRGSASTVTANSGFPMMSGGTFSPDNPIVYRGATWWIAASGTGSLCYEDYR